MTATFIRIAGTSSGGSSYTHRIMSALVNDCDDVENLHVIIGAGEKQDDVARIVQKQVDELLNCVAFFGGRVTIAVEVLKECNEST